MRLTVKTIISIIFPGFLGRYMRREIGWVCYILNLATLYFAKFRSANFPPPFSSPFWVSLLPWKKGRRAHYIAEKGKQYGENGIHMYFLSLCLSLLRLAGKSLLKFGLLFGLKLGSVPL